MQESWLTTEQLALATQEARRLGKSIWTALVKLGILSQEDIAIFFAQESGIPYVRISDYQISDEVIRLIDEEFCRDHLIFPMFKIKDTVFVACANPFETIVMDSLITKTSCEVQTLIANASAIIQAQDQYFGLEDRNFEVERFAIKQKPMSALPFYRSSARVRINTPVWIYVEDKELVLHYSSQIEGITKDMSSDGTAIGLYVFLFVPKGVKLALDFKSSKEPFSSSSSIKVKGEVVYCRMEKGLRYFLGIRFLQMDDKARRQLLNLAKQKKLQT